MRSFTTELLAWDLQEPRGRDVTDPPHDVTADAGKGGGGGGGVAAASPPPSPPPPPPPPPLPAPPEGDSSGDSDDTVIEELPPPRPERGRDVTSDPAMTSSAASHPSPSPPPRPAGWEGEGGEGGEGAGPQPPPHTPTPPRRLLLPRTEVHDLLYWRDPKKSGVTFGLSLLLLLSLATFSAVTVLAHLALALLSVTISLRVYRAVLQALQKKEEGHPFRAYLALDVTVSPETFREVTATLSQHLTRGLRLLLRLFLVEDLVDSLKLAMAMWLLTYVGAVFNGITLLILAELLAFSLPPLYEKYKVQIDHSLELIRCHTKDLMATLQAKLPGSAKKKAE